MTPPETCAEVLQFVNSSSRRGLAQDCLQGSGRSLPPRGEWSWVYHSLVVADCLYWLCLLVAGWVSN